MKLFIIVLSMSMLPWLIYSDFHHNTSIVNQTRLVPDFSASTKHTTGTTTPLVTITMCNTSTTTPPVTSTMCTTSTTTPPVTMCTTSTTTPPVTSTICTTSTTTPPVTTTEHTTLKPEQVCALAYYQNKTEGNPEEGYGFGTRDESCNFTITFKTYDQHGGIIFYAAAEADESHFMAIYMKNGQVHFAFSCGDGAARVSSSQTYNDSSWHTLTVVPNMGHGKLVVDSHHIGEASVVCNGQLGFSPPYSYGGSNKLTDTFMKNLEGFYQPFNGCFKDVMMNGQYLSQINDIFKTGCIYNFDNVYFGPSNNTHSNYLRLTENLGSEFVIFMSLKPRNLTGLLLSINDRRNFLVLELLENELVAKGEGDLYISHKISNGSEFTRNWHLIQVSKSYNSLTFGLDGQSSGMSMGVAGGRFSDVTHGRNISTVTRSPIYIGGHKDISKLPGVRSRTGFSGCIRYIVLQETPVKIPIGAAFGNTHIGGCPTD